MPFLCQLRKNGNVIRNCKQADLKAVVGFLKEVTTFLDTHTDPDLIKQLAISIQEDDGVKQHQFQAIVLYTLKDNQAEEDGKPSLPDLKHYIEQATRITLDDEHGNPFGLHNPVVLVDTLMPLQFDMPQVDPLQVCYYFRRRGFIPDKLAIHKGNVRRIVSYPFPTDKGLGIMLVDDKSLDVRPYEADLLDVKLV